MKAKLVLPFAPPIPRAEMMATPAALCSTLPGPTPIPVRVIWYLLSIALLYSGLPASICPPIVCIARFASRASAYVKNANPLLVPVAASLCRTILSNVPNCPNRAMSWARVTQASMLPT